MNVLLVHQNFPGQFRHLARALAVQGHRVQGLGDAARIGGRAPPHPAVQVAGYRCDPGKGPAGHHYLTDFQAHIRRGQAVVRAVLALREQGFVPDLILAHPGWGEGLFLRDVCPAARLVQYCEYYYQAEGGDLGFDPEFPATFDDRFRVRIRNSTQLHGLVVCDQGLAPTGWQRARYPALFHDRIAVAHDGIDTDRVRPDPHAWISLAGERLTAADELVTYVARNLEPYRGFHIFMRALPRLLDQRPRARVLIVGGDEVSYGRRLPPGQTYRERYRTELGDRVDWRRVHFLGKLPYDDYLRLLQVSRVHLYLTYPFVLSWSALEAMAAGCVLVASDTAPVREVVRHGHNGLLVDFFDAAALADTAAAVLADPAGHRDLGRQARADMLAHHDLTRHCLPAQLSLLLP